MLLTTVPHVQQLGVTHCGVACLEMIYKYHGINDATQEEIWELRKTPRTNSTDYFMLTSSMIQDLLSRDFDVISGQITLKENLCLGSINRHIKQGLPIIVCKQWPANPILGHFVVIIGIEDNDVVYLDPSTGPAPVRNDISDFINEWKSLNPTDPNREVIGGQFILMGNQQKPLKINKFHATNFYVPAKLKSLCLETVTFDR